MHLDSNPFRWQGIGLHWIIFMRRTLSCALVLFIAGCLAQAAEQPSGASSSSSKTSTRTTDTPAGSGSKKSSAGNSPQTPSAPEPQKSDAPKRRTVLKDSTSKEKLATDISEKDKLAAEDERFSVARKAASEDPRIVELRAKADAAKTDEASSKALRSYFRALYEKMREISPALEERINLTETAALRALPASK